MNLTEQLYPLLFFVMGSVMGSFLNVCCYRLPKNLSVITPSSHCPSCQKLIPWFDNIPIVSYVLLGGTCRFCHGSIRKRYLLMELTSGMLWLFAWVYYGISPAFVTVIIFYSLLFIVMVTDFETGLIPDSVTLPGIVLGLALSVWNPALHLTFSPVHALGESLTGLLTGGVLIYVTGFIGNRVFKKETMGKGDLKLLAMAGSFLGWEKVILTFFTAPFLALPLAMYGHWVKKEETIPYGPFLSLAAMIQFLYGQFLWNSLLGF